MNAAKLTALGGAYRQYTRRKWLALGCLLLLTAALGLLCICVGTVQYSPSEVVRGIFGGGTDQLQIILRRVRLPRVAAAAVVGMALSLAGCVMQNVLRNPLASASTLGVSQGASFGAAFAIVYLDAGIQVNASTAASVSITNPVLVTVCAFLGGIATTLVILALSRTAAVTPAAMVLAGVALSSLFSGGTAMVQYFADDVKVASVVYWTFGDLGRASWREIGLISVLTFAAAAFFFYRRWDYNALEGGMQTARSLGVGVDALVLCSMCLCALVTAVAVAFVGCISFIGLIAPHMARRLVGGDHRFLLPAAALTGAAVLMAAELAARTLVSPSILPIGALTSFLGAPLFLYLIFKGGAGK